MSRHDRRSPAGMVLAALILAAPANAGALLDGLAGSGTYADLSAEFEARLLDLHPPGTPVDALWTVLEAEGFEVGNGGARRERWGFLCRPVWLVRWEEEDGRLTALEGERNAICL